jgi:hypothetical protein
MSTTASRLSVRSGGRHLNAARDERSAARGKLHRILNSSHLGRVRLGARVLACAALALGTAVSLSAGFDPAETSAAPTVTRDSLANGCFGLRAAVRDRFIVKEGGGYSASAALAGAEPFRMKATGPGPTCSRGGAAPSSPSTFSAASCPTVRRRRRPNGWCDRSRFTLLNRREEKFLAVSSSGRLIRERKPDAFTFSPSTGCSQYPEIEVGASRRPRGSQFVYVVRGGIVRFVGVGTKQVTSDAGVLSGYVARAGLR